MAKKTKQQQLKSTPKRQVDLYFEQLESDYQHPTNRLIQYIGLPVFSFAVLGLVWMIPFPEIAFLEKRGYHTFLNWGSFFIAGMIYYYLRLATTLSYAVLLTIGLFSYFIVQLEYVERDGGPAVWVVCGALFAASLILLWIGKGMEGKHVPVGRFLRLLLLGPIWLWHFVFKRWKIPY